MKKLRVIEIKVTLFFTIFFCVACIHSCVSDADADDYGQNNACKKCIEVKPEPTPFSTTLNNVNHTIPLTLATDMVKRYRNNRGNVINTSFGTVDVLPYYETFNLKAIDSLICQPNTIGFRVYMAMDATNDIRFILVGVDGDGKDVLQRIDDNPSIIDAMPVDISAFVAEAGQRWP